VKKGRAYGRQPVRGTRKNEKNVKTSLGYQGGKAESKRDANGESTRWVGKEGKD